MKVYKYNQINNNEIVKTNSIFIIKSKKWIDSHGNIHKMSFTRLENFHEKYVYNLHLYGSSKTVHKNIISLNWFENQLFKYMQNNHILKNNTFYKWLIGILITILFALLNYYKK